MCTCNYFLSESVTSLLETHVVPFLACRCTQTQIETDYHEHCLSADDTLAKDLEDVEKVLLHSKAEQHDGSAFEPLRLQIHPPF